ncbi:MAG: rod shape-determining protein [Bacteroidales bacterium]|nr:rod shape-determining protein [Bacteroidales bacterium]
MLLSAIDIGSNAVRLFFSNVFEKDSQIIVEKASLMRIPIRLGEDVFVKNKISEKKIRDLIKTMQAFKLLIEVNNPDAYKAYATSAMREARNSKEVIDRIAKASKIKIEIIDGVKEAQIVGAIQNLDMVSDYKYSLFIDVGGGSTELSLMSKKGIVASTSFKIGTVRMLNEKVKESEWDDMKDWLLQYKNDFKDILCVGAGGNINKIAKLFGRVPEKTLPFNNLEYALSHLKRFTLQERIELMGLRPDRADVIIPAAEIFYFIMKIMEAGLLLVPKIGLSDGMVSLLYKEMQVKKKK